MATDYDSLRHTEIDDTYEYSIEVLKAHHGETGPDVGDIDEVESVEPFEPPGADLSGEELAVRVIPKRPDEFTCSNCFLVYHRSRLARETNGVTICADCAS
ncbi:DUF4193 domain-containing protein [Mycobacterium sp. SM1]|uniref:DUF4193 domain-containing protein n=1 Tax=Mycobacterium sp. SM1 TaxID=2816243 RepID=UPI001BCFD0AC|nr:DUF4193 domain-containing protein [Mycobacterium sp. SM1]MBS4726971.1 DUF4193 domain-containing protein [Mycobacterium sp. SM1]